VYCQSDDLGNEATEYMPTALTKIYIHQQDLPARYWPSAVFWGGGDRGAVKLGRRKDRKEPYAEGTHL
jgi:hypothetical protein